MGPIGIPEMMAIVLLALLLFGPKKLPELGRMAGKGLTEFRRIKNEFSRTFETHMRELEREAKLSELQSSPTAIPPASSYPSTSYSYPYEESHADGIPGIAPSEQATNTEFSAPYEPSVSSAGINGTVARSTTDFSSGAHPSNGGSELTDSIQPTSEAVAIHPEADEEHRA